MISRSLDPRLDQRFVSCMQPTVTRPMISLTNKSCKLAGSLLPSSQILHSFDVFPRCSHTMDRRTEVQISSCCSSLHLGLSHLSPSHRLNLDTYEMHAYRPRRAQNHSAKDTPSIRCIICSLRQLLTLQNTATQR